MIFTAKKKLSFEQALDRLEKIVAAIEGNEVTLDESVKLYKEGMEMSAICAESLRTAEKEITVLRQRADGMFVLSPYESESME